MTFQAFNLIEPFSAGVLAALLVAFAVLSGLLYFIFRLLKRSVKMAFRMAVVGAVFVIVALGGISVWYFGAGFFEGQKAKPAVRRSK